MCVGGGIGLCECELLVGDEVVGGGVLVFVGDYVVLLGCVGVVIVVGVVGWVEGGVVYE